MRESSMSVRTTIDKKREEILAKRKNLLALMRQDNADRNAVTAVVSEISGLQEEMQRIIAMHMLNMKAELDKEQQKEFLDLIENTMTQGRQPVCPPN
jgi:Spy/CpxP family protein refolding chaperone